MNLLALSLPALTSERDESQSGSSLTEFSNTVYSGHALSFLEGGSL